MDDCEAEVGGTQYTYNGSTPYSGGDIVKSFFDEAGDSLLDGRAADTAVGVINQEVNWVVHNFTFGLAPELDLGPLYGHYDSYESGKPVGDATTWAMEKAGMAAALRKQVKELFTKKIGTKVGDDAAEQATEKVAAAPKTVADKFRRTPTNLSEKLAMDEAMGGAGKKVMSGLNDPKFKGMEKWQHVHRNPDGTITVIHYVRDPATGNLLDFKFK